MHIVENILAHKPQLTPKSIPWLLGQQMLHRRPSKNLWMTRSWFFD